MPVPEELYLESSSDIPYIITITLNKLQKYLHNTDNMWLSSPLKDKYDISNVVEINVNGPNIPQYIIDRLSKECDNINLLGLPYIQNIIKYNCLTSYDWAVEKWGTKWDIQNEEEYPYEGEPALKGFNFKTPWSPPYKALIELSSIENITLFIIFDTEACQRYDPTIMIFKNGECCMVELPFCPLWEDIESDDEYHEEICKANYLNSLALKHAFLADNGYSGIKISEEEINHIIYEVCGIKRTTYTENEDDISIIDKCIFDWYEH